MNEWQRIEGHSHTKSNYDKCPWKMGTCVEGEALRTNQGMSRFSFIPTNAVICQGNQIKSF
ncbi:hypothetical protein C0J52_03140 [Blattella germanica]|nr:hypothetical protein C0J52_03140 [Blattella germanica]